MAASRVDSMTCTGSYADTNSAAKLWLQENSARDNSGDKNLQPFQKFYNLFNPTGHPRSSLRSLLRLLNLITLLSNRVRAAAYR